MLWETPRHAHFLVKTANQIAENILDEAKKRDLEVSDSPKTEQLAFSDVFECARARYENWALAFDRIKAMRDDGLDRQTYRERARVENALNDLKIPSNDCPKQLRLLLFAATRYLGASGAEESHEFPKSAEICKFLVQSGATPTVAKQIAKIIRPDSLPKPTHK